MKDLTYTHSLSAGHAFLSISMGKCLEPSTALLSTPSQPSSRVAYTRRKSTDHLRSPPSRSSSGGCEFTAPPFAPGPTTNRHDAAPWSVPWLPFSFTLRPNSENEIGRAH